MQVVFPKSYIRTYAGRASVCTALPCTGLYWIDPNAGHAADALQVQCSFEDGSCATCIDPRDTVSHNESR